jgi:hypothetical protein
MYAVLLACLLLEGFGIEVRFREISLVIATLTQNFIRFRGRTLNERENTLEVCTRRHA